MENYIEKNNEEPIFDSYRANIAQEEYCNENDYPFFAPSDGICWKCGNNIYEKHKRNENISTGYSLQFASHRLITGCPHCHWSFCD